MIVFKSALVQHEKWRLVMECVSIHARMHVIADHSDLLFAKRHSKNVSSLLSETA